MVNEIKTVKTVFPLPIDAYTAALEIAGMDINRSRREYKYPPEEFIVIEPLLDGFEEKIPSDLEHLIKQGYAVSTKDLWLVFRYFKKKYVQIRQQMAAIWRSSEKSCAIVLTPCEGGFRVWLIKDYELRRI